MKANTVILLKSASQLSFCIDFDKDIFIITLLSHASKILIVNNN